MRLLVPAWPPGAHASATQRPQALGAAVDRGGQPGRAAAEHDEVEALAVDLGAQPELARDLGGRGVAQHAVVADQDRRLVARDVEPVERSWRLRVGVDVVEAHRQQVALEQVAHLEGPARVALRRSAAARRGPSPSCQARRASRRAEHELAELRLAGEHRAQARRGRRRSPRSARRRRSSRSPARPVNVAMSPMKVPASASAIQTSLPGCRSMKSTRPRSITKKGASRWPCS